MTNLTFKKIIVVFWTFWWLIALWTDAIGGLAHLGLLHASWAPDTNYPFLAQTLMMYSKAPWVPTFFFGGIILWSTAATGLFCYASMGLGQAEAVWLGRARRAFVLSLTYWLAFFLADQMVMKFDLEENHMVQGGFELLTFLALYLLPNSDKTTNA